MKNSESPWLKNRPKISRVIIQILAVTILTGSLALIQVSGQETKPAPAMTPLPSPWSLQKEAARQSNLLPRYLDLLRLESQYRKSASRSDSYLQARGTIASFLGDIREANLYFDEAHGALNSRAAAKPFEHSPLEKLKPVDAEAFLLKAAETNRVLMINDGHHQPQTRVLITRLLSGLYQRGFRYLALETLAASFDGSEAARRKYLIADDGTMTNEPVFGDLARQALKMGFTLVPYEFEGEAREGETMIDRLNRRETEQARNLKERVFDRDANAKLLVYAGQSHISEQPIPMPEEKEPWIMMAVRFKELTGINPFTVDQQTMISHSRPEAEPMIYRAAVERGWIKKKAVIFIEGNGLAWTQPTEAMNVDAQVFLPPVSFDRERPDWLERDLKRVSYEIPKNLLGSSQIYLIQAFFEKELVNAVPVDQILVRSAQPTPSLMLPRRKGQGRFRLRVIDEKGKTTSTKPLKL